MNLLSRLAGLPLRAHSTWVVVLAAFLWFAATTWSWPLLLPDEGRYVGVAWGMLSRGEWGVPLLNGLPFFHKPPLFYWVTASAMWVFGVNEWAARLASVLGATLMVGALYWFLKVHAERTVAVCAAVALALQPFVFGASHYANLDMLVAGIITATIVLAASAVLRAEQAQPYRLVLVLAYVALALGFLAKGLIGVVLPAGIIFAWLVVRGRYRILWKLLWLPGIAVFLALSLPWMWAMQQQYPDFFDYYILYQHFHRFLEKGFNNARPFWFYLPVLLLLALPWSTQLWKVFTGKYWSEQEHAPIRSLMAAWFLVVFLFFSIPNSKLAGYVLPCAPPIAYFVADLFSKGLQGRTDSRAHRVFGSFIAIALAICVGAVIAISFANRPSGKMLALQLASVMQPADRLVMLGRIQYDLNFYLRAEQPAWVVADWNAPDIRNIDNWRKELFDAAPFDRRHANELLVRLDQLNTRLCEPHTGTLWLVGAASAFDKLPGMEPTDPDISAGGLHAWGLSPEKRFKICAGTPKIALE
ncbi:MAG TPA: glycosyltransferase family 39 protein [Pusillimonas sp.]|uniref:ArnT family glycosyltransferase n=1 Tax=Pusillimonas sp. TaxID=3040095 RepID=UPI002CB5FB6C|nr:glycosyltransferase family 39 protein [Pusillimonas sp.]HUH87354.1 glycosyltransferase family 39 protein [Pusillimonas sp.]